MSEDQVALLRAILAELQTIRADTRWMREREVRRMRAARARMRPGEWEDVQRDAGEPPYLEP